MELGAPRVGDAVDRPDPAVLREVRRRLRVPVLGVEDAGARLPGHLDLGVDPRNDPGAPGHRQPAGWVGEIVLDVHDDERRGRVVALHVRSVSGSLRPMTMPLFSGSAPRRNASSTWRLSQREETPELLSMLLEKASVRGGVGDHEEHDVHVAVPLLERQAAARAPGRRGVASRAPSLRAAREARRRHPTLGGRRGSGWHFGTPGGLRR